MTKRMTAAQYNARLRREEPELYSLIREYWGAIAAKHRAESIVRRATQSLPVPHRTPGMWTAIANFMTNEAARVIDGHKQAWARGESDTPVSRWYIAEMEKTAGAIKRKCAAGERKTAKAQATLRRAREMSGLAIFKTALAEIQTRFDEYEPKTLVGLQAILPYISREAHLIHSITYSATERLIEERGKAGAKIDRVVARARRKVKALSKQPAQKRAA